MMKLVSEILDHNLPQNRILLEMRDPPSDDELVSRIARNHRKSPQFRYLEEDREYRNTLGSVLYRHPGRKDC